MRTVTTEESSYIEVALRDATADQPRSGKSLAQGLEMSIGEEYTDSEIRGIIHTLRRQGTPIAANGAGYYMADDPDDLLRQAKSMERRAKAIRAAARAVKAKADSMRGTTR